MPQSYLVRAQQTIENIQGVLDGFRMETYKTVHDKIGSTLSAVSIKVKMLTDSIEDASQKKQITEIHAMIRECLEYVTTLNRQLKPHSWIPSSTVTFLDDLQKDLKIMGKEYSIDISIEVSNDGEIKKTNFSDIILMYESVFGFVQDCIPRLVKSLRIEIEAKPGSIAWTFSDDSPLAPNEDSFGKLIEKIQAAKGSFATTTENKKNISKLVFPIREKT